MNKGNGNWRQSGFKSNVEPFIYSLHWSLFLKYIAEKVPQDMESQHQHPCFRRWPGKTERKSEWAHF